MFRPAWSVAATDAVTSASATEREGSNFVDTMMPTPDGKFR
jgi:hypothetical protein